MASMEEYNPVSMSNKKRHRTTKTISTVKKLKTNEPIAVNTNPIAMSTGSSNADFFNTLPPDLQQEAIKNYLKGRSSVTMTPKVVVSDDEENVEVNKDPEDQFDADPDEVELDPDDEVNNNVADAFNSYMEGITADSGMDVAAETQDDIRNVMAAETTVEESSDSESDDEEELESLFEKRKNSFPSAKDVRNAEINPVSTLPKDVVYFVLSAKKSTISYEEEGGQWVDGESAILKVVPTTAKSVDERLNVRLTGIAYKIFTESRYERCHTTDDYYLIYRGKKESSLGRKYNNVKVLHREIGTKHFKVDGQVFGQRQNSL